MRTNAHRSMFYPCSWSPQLVQAPAHGTVTLGTGPATFVDYAPASGYTGPDSFVVRSSADPASPTQTVTVEISDDGNLPPSCAAADAHTDTDSPVIITFYCSDPDQDPVSVAVGGAPVHGMASLTSQPQRQFTYTPDGSHVGVDAFTVAVSDGHGGTSTARGRIFVRPPGSINPPTCHDLYHGIAVNQSLGLSFACEGPSGSPLSIQSPEGPTHGTLSGLGTASVTYIPAPGFVGTDTFTLKASVGVVQSNVGRQTVNVGAPPPLPPPCADVATTVAPGAARSMPPCSGIFGQPTVEILPPPTLGTVVVSSKGVVTYRAGSDKGTDHFTYSVTGSGPLGPGTVTATVAIADLPPAPFDPAPNVPNASASGSGSGAASAGGASGPSANLPSSHAAKSKVAGAAFRPGYTRATDLSLGAAIAWLPPGVLKAPRNAAPREVLLLACANGCTVRYSFALLLERGRAGNASPRTIVLKPRTLKVPKRDAGVVALKLDAAARRALRAARSARLRISLRVTGPRGTRVDTKTLSLR